MEIQYPPMILSDDFVEHRNIAWRIEPGVQDSNNPLLPPKYPWDAGATFSHGTVLKDPIDGLYKAWYISTPVFTKDRQLTYAFSEDGRVWTRPELDVYACDGYERTNIVLGAGMGGQVTQVSVFIHPDAEPDRRYEMFCFRNPTYKWKTPGYGNPSGRIDGLSLASGQSVAVQGLYRHFSNDGIHWIPEGEPLAGNQNTQDAFGGRPFIASDGLYVFQFNDGRYVIYDKMRMAALPNGRVPYDIAPEVCRVMVRRESLDGWQWPHTYENVLIPDWRDRQDTQFAELMVNEYSGGFIGVATVYHALDQTIDLQLAGSRDGRNWFRPAPRRSCLDLAPLGDIGGGMLWPMRGFVLDDGMAHLYYSGLRGIHGNLYMSQSSLAPFHGAFCRASWEIGRMWAAIPNPANVYGEDHNDYTASLTTPLQDSRGKKLILNAVTIGQGKIEAELLDSKFQPINGYTKNDCRPFSGDEKCISLTWKDHETVDVGQTHLRITLTDARLYGYDWK